MRLYWTNLAVGLLGLIVGIDYLMRWRGDDLISREFIIGLISTLVALLCLVYVFVKNAKD